MSAITLDSNTLYRAVTSHDFKLLAYYLDLRTGEISTRTLAPDEVQDVPLGPRVKPLPILGGDLNRKKGDPAFAPAPVEAKKDLFGDTPRESKDPFGGDFWKKDGGSFQNPFGEFKRESSSKKLAEIFGDRGKDRKPKDPFANDGTEPKSESNKSGTKSGKKKALEDQPYVADFDPDEPLQRIPPASREQDLEWRRAFAGDCGDPQIKELLLKALLASEPAESFERSLRKYQRLNQQWMLYHRKQALHYAEVWLKALPIQWEIVEH